MKVHELIEKLSQLNQDFEIVLANDGGWQHDVPINKNELEMDCYIIEGQWL